VLPGQAASKTPSAVPVQTRPAATSLGMGGNIMAGAVDYVAFVT